VLAVALAIVAGIALSLLVGGAGGGNPATAADGYGTNTSTNPGYGTNTNTTPTDTNTTPTSTNPGYGTNTGATPAGGSSQTSPGSLKARDFTGPRFGFPKQRRIRVSRRWLFFFLIGPFDENAAVDGRFSTASRVVVIPSRKRILALGRRKGSARAGKRLKLKIKVNRKARRTLRRRKRLRTRAVVTAVDAAGNRTTHPYKFTLLAPKRKHRRR
jgi:hypothetical protein